MRLFFPTLFLMFSNSLIAQLSVSDRKLADTTHSTPLYSYLNSIQGDVRACVWIKDGKIISECYKETFYNNLLLPLNSVTKSVVSILTGIAIQQGYIESEQQLVTDLIPRTVISNPDPRWRKLTVQHLLTMKSGLTFSSLEETCLHCKTLEETMEHVEFNNYPGVKFDYNEITVQLLILVLQHTVKMPVNKFAEASLFRPLGITNYNWTQKMGVCTEGGLQLTAADLAKIAWLMTNSGKWKDTQLVSKEFWFNATDSSLDYGYLCWTKPDGSFWGIGNHGKYVFCSPYNKSTLVVLADISEEQSTDVADSIYKKFTETDHVRYYPSLKESRLLSDTFAKVTLPDWLNAFIGKPVKSVSGPHSASLILSCDENQSLRIRVDKDNLIWDLNGGNGRNLLSHLQFCEDNTTPFAKEYLCVHLEPHPDGIKFIAKGVTTGSSFTFYLAKQNKTFILSTFTNNEDIHFKFMLNAPK